TEPMDENWRSLTAFCASSLAPANLRRLLFAQGGRTQRPRAIRSGIVHLGIRAALVTRERAVAAECSGLVVFQPATERRHVERIEIDQVFRSLRAVRIMARGA